MAGRLGWSLLATAAVFAPAGYYSAAALEAAADRISITATKFEFSATEIRVTKGRKVTIVLTSPDFAHGFAIPDLDVRADLVPGRTVELTFTPNRAGRFVFLCDNFCGESHDDMTGLLVVTEK